jgi:hypothetical protein
MKAFEEWWKNVKFEGYYKMLSPDDYFDHMAPYNIGEKIWRAALEQILKNETVKPILGGEHRYIDSIFLRNELEN